GWSQYGNDGGWRGGKIPKFVTIKPDPLWDWNRPGYYEPYYVTINIPKPTWPDIPLIPIVTIEAPPPFTPYDPGCRPTVTTKHTETTTEATYTSTITDAPDGDVIVYQDSDGQEYTYGASTIYEIYIYTTVQSIDLIGPGFDCPGGASPGSPPPGDGGSSWSPPSGNPPPGDGGSSWSPPPGNPSPKDGGSSWSPPPENPPPKDGGSSWSPPPENGGNSQSPPSGNGGNSWSPPPEGGARSPPADGPGTWKKEKNIVEPKRMLRRTPRTRAAGALPAYVEARATPVA
ncbi:hypothetical protein BLS_007119, partial [Venturia inaequalis]